MFINAGEFIAAATAEDTEGELTNIGILFYIPIGVVAHSVDDIMSVELEFITGEQSLWPERSEVERFWARSEIAAQIINWVPTNGSFFWRD